MDRIVLRGIDMFAYGGVTDAEHQIGQRYRVDVEIERDLKRAGQTDAIEDTVHYGQVHDAVRDALRERPFRLIEAAADRVAGVILSTFDVDAVTIRLEKLLPPIDGIVASAAVEIRRVRPG